MNPVVKYILEVLILIFLQVLVVNQIDLGALGSWFSPVVFTLFILTLPFNLSPGWLMLIAFATGVTVDVFTDTLGMHGSAALVLAFLRPYLLKLLAPREGFDETKRPGIYTMGLTQFITYAGSLLLIYHIWFFTVEVLRFSGFHIILLKSFISSVGAILIILLIQYLTLKRS